MHGFTMVELALSLAFIGTLSVIIVVIISNTVSSYQRGMTLNKVNTTGMDLVDDFRLAVQNSSSDAVTSLCVDYYPSATDNASNVEARNKCVQDGADSFVRATRKATVKLSGATKNEVIERDDVPVYGVFCTGSYSYMWNSGYFVDDEESNARLSGYAKREVLGVRPVALKYSVNENGSIVSKEVKDFRLLKVKDDTRAVCVAVMRSVIDAQEGNGRGGALYYNSEEVANRNGTIPEVIDISQESGYSYSLMDATEQPVEVLASEADNDLVLYDFYAARPAISSADKHMFYSATFILGTVRGGIDITATGRNCTPPEEYEKEDFNYCAINKFNFAVTASGEVTRR